MARTTLLVNGTSRSIDTEGDPSLLSVLRDQLDLSGTKYGCGEGMCGACTVLIDGQWQRSCITPISKVNGRKITTIEGLARNGELHPLQQAFLDEAAMQCAYCTSGMIMTATALLRKNPNPSEAEIVRYMEGNVCRCGTYPRIVAAIQRAAKMKSGKGASRV